MSKKYRLKKWYPSLSKAMPVGFIMHKNEKLCNYSNLQHSFIAMSLDEVENNPEFWELVEEKEYEILEILNTDYSPIYVGKTIQGWYLHDGFVNEFRSEAWAISRGYKIKSIKRLYDNVIFSIGDKIKVKNSRVDRPEAITEIIFNKEGTPCLFTNSFSNNGVNIFKAVKVEKIITTIDGADLYQGDAFWHVDTYFCVGEGILNTTPKAFKPIEHYKHFSTEKAAKEYVEMNKPRFSKKDLLDASINMQYGAWFIEGLIKRLKK